MKEDYLKEKRRYKEDILGVLTQISTDIEEYCPLYANNDEGGFDFISIKTLGIFRNLKNNNN